MISWLQCVLLKTHCADVTMIVYPVYTLFSEIIINIESLMYSLIYSCLTYNISLNKCPQSFTRDREGETTIGHIN